MTEERSPRETKEEGYSRPEIWRLARFLQSIFSQGTDWVVSDKHGWYDIARRVHAEVYRTSSPYLNQKIPHEAKIKGWGFM